VPGPGGFDIEVIRERARWLSEAAADRLETIERSALVQVTVVGDGAAAAIGERATRYGVERSLVEETPFLMLGSVEQLIDKIERLREDVGISHFVVRDAEGFAPVVERFR
jgi:hypothetical protein